MVKRSKTPTSSHEATQPDSKASHSPIQSVPTSSTASQIPGLLQSDSALFLSALISTSLHLLVQLVLAPKPWSTIYNISSAAISLLWIRMYKKLTRKTGINPMINVAITIGSGVLGWCLKKVAVERGQWVEEGLWELAKRRFNETR